MKEQEHRTASSTRCEGEHDRAASSRSPRRGRGSRSRPRRSGSGCCRSCCARTSCSSGAARPVADTARTLSGYAAAIVVRTFAHSRRSRRSRTAATVPVINALTDEHHPCQALADLLTLRERFGHARRAQGRVRRRGLDNVANSLVEAGALAGIEVGRRLAGRATRRTRTRGAPLDRDDPRRGGRGRATPSTPTSGSRWARRPSRPSALLALTPLPGERRADELRAGRRRDLPALPAGAPRRGGHRRGDRRAAVGGLAAGRRTGCRPRRRCSTHSILTATGAGEDAIVAALGGNALLRRGEPPEAATQRRHVGEAVRALARARASSTISWSRTATGRRWACSRSRRPPTATSCRIRSTCSAPRARG